MCTQKFQIKCSERSLCRIYISRCNSFPLIIVDWPIHQVLGGTFASTKIIFLTPTTIMKFFFYKKKTNAK